VSRAALAGTAVALATATAFAQSWRVVLQDVDLFEVTTVSRDGALVAGTNGRTRTMLYVAQVRPLQLRLALRFPEAIDSVTFTQDGRRVAVSVARSTSLVAMASGKVEETLPGIFGSLTAHLSRPWLGFCGNSGFEIDDLERAASNVGIYDLDRRKCKARGALGNVRESRVAFDGDDLVGVCGKLLLARVERFPSLAIRLTHRGELSATPKASSDRSVPAVLAEAEARVTTAREAVGSSPFSPNPGRASEYEFAAVSLADRFVFSLKRCPGVAALTLRLDGTLDFSKTVPENYEIWPLGDSIVASTWTHECIPFVDLVTGARTFSPEPLASSDWWFVMPAGLLVWRSDRTTFFTPGSTKPAWTGTDRPCGSWPSAVSRDGRVFARRDLGAQDVIHVFRSDTGQSLPEVRLPLAREGNEQMQSMALDAEGKRLALLSGTRLRIVDVASGSIVIERPMTGRSFVSPLRAGWLVSGKASEVLDESAKPVRSLPLAQVEAVQEMDSPRGPRWLERIGEREALVDPQSGALLDVWTTGGRRRSLSTAWSSCVGFGGRVLVRSVVDSATVEIVKLANLEVVATIRGVPVNGAIGWIAFTPDGLWDASPGAEGVVEVFRDGVTGDAEAKASRHDAAEIRARLKSAFTEDK
jgi:hypothetical protein